MESPAIKSENKQKTKTKQCLCNRYGWLLVIKVAPAIL